MNPRHANLNRLSHRRCNRSNHRLGYKTILRSDIWCLCWSGWVYSCWCWCASDRRWRRIACRCKTSCEPLSDRCSQVHYSIINPSLSLYRCSQNGKRNRYSNLSLLCENCLSCRLRIVLPKCTYPLGLVCWRYRWANRPDCCLKQHLSLPKHDQYSFCEQFWLHSTPPTTVISYYFCNL